MSFFFQKIVTKKNIIQSLEIFFFGNKSTNRILLLPENVYQYEIKYILLPLTPYKFWVTLRGDLDLFF